MTVWVEERERERKNQGKNEMKFIFSRGRERFIGGEAIKNSLNCMCASQDSHRNDFSPSIRSISCLDATRNNF